MHSSPLILLAPVIRYRFCLVVVVVVVGVGFLPIVRTTYICMDRFLCVILIPFILLTSYGYGLSSSCPFKVRCGFEGLRSLDKPVDTSKKKLDIEIERRERSGAGCLLRCCTEELEKSNKNARNHERC